MSAWWKSRQSPCVSIGNPLSYWWRSMGITPAGEDDMDEARVVANQLLARQFFAAQDRLRGGPDPDLCAPEYQAELGGSPPMPREAHEGLAVAFYTGFPDMHHEIVDVF